MEPRAGYAGAFLAGTTGSACAGASVALTLTLPRRRGWGGFAARRSSVRLGGPGAEGEGGIGRIFTSGSGSGASGGGAVVREVREIVGARRGLPASLGSGRVRVGRGAVHGPINNTLLTNWGPNLEGTSIFPLIWALFY